MSIQQADGLTPSGTTSLVLSESRWLRFATFTAFYFAQGVPIGLLTIAPVSYTHLTLPTSG